MKSFEDWTSNQFGKKLYSIFFKTYTEKVWGMPCNEMSADWAAQRIKGLSLWGAVTDGLRRSLGLNKRPNDGQAVKTLLETFRYPRLGPGMMWEAARDRIVGGRQGSVLMGHALKQLASDGQGGWRMTATGPDGELVDQRRPRDQLGADARARRAAHPLPDSTIEASQLKYRDFLTVALMIKLGGPVPRQLDLHPRQQGEGRPRAELPLVVARDGARPDVACVGLEYFCFEGDGLWSMADDELVELGQAEMEILGLVDPDKVDRRRGRAPGKGLPGLRRGLRRQRRRDARASSRTSTRRCTSSAATACTATTTRITR